MRRLKGIYAGYPETCTSHILVTIRSYYLFLQSLAFFTNYPNNLPKEVLEHIKNTKVDENRVLDQIRNIIQNPANFVNYDNLLEGFNKGISKDNKQILDLFSDSYIIFQKQKELSKEFLSDSKYEINIFNFEWALYSKEIVSLISFLEAYLEYNIGTILKINPKIAENYLKKPIKQKTLVLLDERAIDEHIAKTQRKLTTSIKKRLSFISKFCYLELKLTGKK